MRCCLSWLVTLMALAAQAAPPWTNGPNLNVGRAGSAATLLADGRVIVTGGYSPTTAAAEVFNPSTNQWVTVMPMSRVRFSHGSVLLRDGRVLVCGGWSNGETNSCELWNPATGIWSSAAPMLSARSEFTLTCLPTGKVLAAGGHDGVLPALSTAELYDPDFNQWTFTPGMGTERRFHAAVLVLDAGVFAIGGQQDAVTNTAMVHAYNIAANTWSPRPSLTNPRRAHSAIAFANGDVLVSGGGESGSAQEGEIFAGGVWLPTQATFTGHYLSTTTLLLDGGVLMVAGFGSMAHGTCEVYDPVTTNWTLTGALVGPRYNHHAILLHDARVMVFGGQFTGGGLVTTEFYGVAVPVDAGVADGGSTDGGSADAGVADGGSTDGGSADGGSADGGSTDGGSTDGGTTDGGTTDGGTTDGGTTDGGTTDGGTTAAGISDAGVDGGADGGLNQSDAGPKAPVVAVVGCDCSAVGSGWTGSMLALIALLRTRRQRACRTNPGCSRSG